MKWEWARRARAWDDAERARLRRAHSERAKKTQERHLNAAQAIFGKVLKAITLAPSEGLSLPQAVSCFERIVNVERRLLGEPVGVELIVRGERPGDDDFADAPREASDVAPDKFRCTPEVLLAVERAMAAHETKVYEPDAEPPATTGRGDGADDRPADDPGDRVDDDRQEVGQ